MPEVAPRHLETARLLLSRPVTADVEEIFARYAADPDVTKFLGWPRHRSIDDTRVFLRFSDASWEQSPAGPYLIRARAGRRLLGSTGLQFQQPGRAATGYVLARDAWGQGFATEALGVMVDLARRLGVTELHAFCHPDHALSRRVLEKCGFSLDPAWTGAAEFPNLGSGAPQPACRYVREMTAGSRDSS